MISQNSVVKKLRAADAGKDSRRLSGISRAGRRVPRRAPSKIKPRTGRSTRPWEASIP